MDENILTASLGCPQCKQRRIKCDETLPHCKKCSARSVSMKSMLMDLLYHVDDSTVLRV